MSGTASRILVWLMLLTVPIQGLAALTTALGGPSHYHPAQQARHAHAARNTEAVSHTHRGARHAHGDVRRHYHLPGESAAVVTVGAEHEDLAAPARSSEAQSASAAFVALLPGYPGLRTPALAHILQPGDIRRLRSRVPRRIERPPRLHPR